MNQEAKEKLLKLLKRQKYSRESNSRNNSQMKGMFMKTQNYTMKNIVGPIVHIVNNNV